ncbi:conjugal transfer protein (plasmid) [Halarchaeum sp. CBA1220]|uniref:ATP-binding protein n=1 Tax=Halarchaeum sp. CBA1220 TaxID=1853682 RepID=UPI000F3A8C24|nr:ATP-binding protein [Halarchaeum sp. CBA1220]QLC35482.1 conjugal transfer protein [Halarchaeum sp. CBA1220]
MSEYLRVTPTSEELDPSGIPRLLESLHKLTREESGLGSRLNPLSSSTPPRFEFLALSDGDDAPVEFYYGADDALDTVEERLQSIYPTTFDIERVDLDVEERLVQPTEYSREEFVDAYQQGALQYEFGEDEQYELTDEGEAEAADVDVTADSVVSVGETALELAVADNAPVEKPSVTEDGTILARPATETVSPYGVRWQGAATRKKDWMTSLTPFTDGEDEESLSAVNQPGAALASLIDHVNDATEPLAFQVVFERRESWQSDAELRKEDLIDGRDTWAQRIIGDLLEFEEYERDERELSDIVERRLNAIEATNPQRSFTVNVRAVGVPTSDTGKDSLDERLSSLAPVFDPLDGPFYDVEAERVRESGFREAKKEKNARKALQRLLNRDIVTGRWKNRPDFVLSGRELAHFLLVPSAEQLSIEGSRGTRAEQQSRNPLSRPDPDLMSEFREGMAVGYALDETGEPENEPVRIPPSLLPTHYGRFGTTGAGKSKAQINELLSLYANTEGPSILIEPKGDGMTENYMRAHAARFGIDDLEENVIHFSIPEDLPGFSFFNIQPALENGVRREDAIQKKADHYEEILKLVMGQDRYERATVAPGLIKTLIKALFDAEHGRENGQYRESADYFAHRQLENALDQLWEAGPPQPDLGAAPQSTDEAVTRSLRRQLQADKTTFSNIMGGVSNRLGMVSDDANLRRIFNNTEPQFDFRDLLDEDTVILFDLGDLREDAARIMTGVILTNLEAALQEENQDAETRPEDYVVNLLIDEAASVAVSDVMNNLLEQGRSFRLSVGLSMQFPEQMKAEGGRRAYLNVLNNIGSPLVGKISVDRELAQAMAHEEMDPEDFANRIRSLPRGEWIANLPSPVFGETGPYPFSLAPLPIPKGHPESDQPLTSDEEARFEEALTRIHTHVNDTYGVTEDATPTTQTPEELGDVLDVADGELDVALAKVVRSVQLRTNRREANDWVAVETVDDELRRLFEDADADAPTYDELASLRQRSRFLETTVDMDTDELVIRLTDDGEDIATPDTGSVQSAGSQKHDTALEQIEQELTAEGFTISILTQDGSEKPDARATHPDFEDAFAIEVETTTPENPAKVLVNLRKAQDEGEFPLFVVRPGSSQTEWAERIEQILNPPVRELSAGETRYYTTDENLTFNGGATEDGGVTAVRPVEDTNSTQTAWCEESGKLVLRTTADAEILSVDSLTDLSKGRMPATYSYDPAAEEYIVYEEGTRHIYESKQAFEANWARIKRPFVPRDDLAVADAEEMEYAIIILPRDGSATVYSEGRTYPIDTLQEVIESQDSPENQLMALQSLSQPDIEEIADDPDAVVGQFAAQCLSEAPDERVTAGDVYTAYEQWAENHGIEPDSKSWFARRLNKQLSLERTTDRRGGNQVRYYEGIKLTKRGGAD